MRQAALSVRKRSEDLSDTLGKGRSCAPYERGLDARTESDGRHWQ